MAVTLTYGRDGCIGHAEESTWGTQVASDQWSRVLSCSIARKEEKQRRKHLHTGSGSANVRGHFLVNSGVEGNVVMEMSYEGCGRFIKHALGGTPNTTGTNPYTHTINLAAELPTGLSIERVYGRDKDGTLQAEKFEGCLIASAKWSWSAGDGPGTMDLSIIGETSGGMVVASGTPSFSSNDVPVLDTQGGTFTFNSVTYTPDSVEITLDNAIGRRRRLGSALTARPARTGEIKVGIKVTVEMDAYDAHAAYLADTQGDVVITFTGTGGRSMTITGHNGYMTSYDAPTSDPGIIKRTFEFECENDGTDQGLTFVIVNTQSSAVAA